MTAVATRPVRTNAVIAAVQKRPGPIAVRDQMQRSVVAAGLRGQKGESGQELPAIAYAFGDASPRLLHSVDDDSVLVSVQLIVDVPFDGLGATMRVLTQGGDVLLDSDQVAANFAATYESTPAKLLTVGTGIYLEITPGAGATAGSGYVVLNLN